MEIWTDKLIRGAMPIADPVIVAAIQKLPLASYFDANEPKLLPAAILTEYLAFLPEWLQSSKLNSLIGLNQFGFKRLTAGITQAFDSFYIRHHQRHFKFLAGEYPYLRRFVKNWSLYNKLTEQDALIISAPFSGTGALHPDFYNILAEATDLQVPVLVDCAFYGICQGLVLDLNYPCIESVCFSLSKIFTSGCFRSGIEFCRHNEGSIATLNKWVYVPLLSAKIGLELIKIFSPDYIFNKYRDKQNLICAEYGLQPADTVIFGLGNEKFNYFEIDNAVNRCCLSPRLKEMDDFSKIPG
jgi:hypothetical protein